MLMSIWVFEKLKKELPRKITGKEYAHVINVWKRN